MVVFSDEALNAQVKLVMCSQDQEKGIITLVLEAGSKFRFTDLTH
jgi:hypothetical protein